MNNFDLIKQYVDTGLILPEYQLSKLNNNLKQTYVRKRLIAIKDDCGLLTPYEETLLSKDSVWKYLEHKISCKLEGISNFCPSGLESTLKFVGLTDDYNKLKSSIGDRNINTFLLSKFGKTTYSSWYICDTIPEYFENSDEVVLRDFADKRLEQLMYYNLKIDEWLLKYAGNSINSFIDNFEKRGDSYTGNYFSNKLERFEKIGMFYLSVFMNYKRFIDLISSRTLVFMLAIADDDIRISILNLYISKGGSIDIINSNKYLKEWYNKQLKQ